ncbi:MAG: hypothetical protein M3R48_06870 [Candidatus Dormibacteraeota bacterium]|nr:hypothetical protein [Candidatus Dormibacteraeota bacterium]
MATRHEGDAAYASVDEALLWTNVYTALVRNQTAVVDRVEALVHNEAVAGLREDDVGVLVAQLARLRSRLRLWESRLDDHPSLAPSA